MKTAIITIEGVIGTPHIEDQIQGEKYVELVDVISQVKSQEPFDKIQLRVSSPGGYVHVGEQIYDYLKSLKLPIHSVGYGIVASMGAEIFSAGDTRELMPSTEKYFMIHLPSGGIEGNSKEINDYNNFIQDTAKKSIKFYTQLTGVGEDGIRPLLENETWLSVDEAYELGFTTVAPRAKKAIAYFNSKPKIEKMSKTKLQESETEMITQGFINFFKSLGGKKAKNLLVIDAIGTEIDFTDLEEMQQITEGDEATIDGVPAEGEYILPNETVLTFVDGKVSTVVEKETEGEDTEEDGGMAAMEQLQKELDVLAAEKETLTQELETSKSEAIELQTRLEDSKAVMQKFKENLTSKFGENFDFKKKPKTPELSSIQQMKAKIKTK